MKQSMYSLKTIYQGINPTEFGEDYFPVTTDKSEFQDNFTILHNLPISNSATKQREAGDTLCTISYLQLVIH